MSTSVNDLAEALMAYRRLLLPIDMTLAERDMTDEPLDDGAILFSFMGSGASDHVTIGEYRAVRERAAAALTKATA